MTTVFVARLVRIARANACLRTASYQQLHGHQQLHGGPPDGGDPNLSSQREREREREHVKARRRGGFSGPHSWPAAPHIFFCDSNV